MLTSSSKSYSEAIETLYACNSFHFNLIEVTRRFSLSIPSYRLNVITLLELDLRYRVVSEPTDRAFYGICWDECWHMVADMQGLRQLWVAINITSDYWPPLPPPPLKQILDPLRAVTRPKLFEVSVPMSTEYGSIEIQDAPFVFQWGRPCTGVHRSQSPRWYGDWRLPPL